MDTRFKTPKKAPLCLISTNSEVFDVRRRNPLEPARSARDGDRTRQIDRGMGAAERSSGGTILNYQPDCCIGSRAPSCYYQPELGIVPPEPQERKTALAGTIAQGRSVALWGIRQPRAQEHSVPLGPPARSPGHRRVQPPAHRQCAVGRMARRAYRASYESARSPNAPNPSRSGSGACGRSFPVQLPCPSSQR